MKMTRLNLISFKAYSYSHLLIVLLDTRVKTLLTMLNTGGLNSDPCNTITHTATHLVPPDIALSLVNLARLIVLVVIMTCECWVYSHSYRI